MTETVLQLRLICRWALRNINARWQLENITWRLPDVHIAGKLIWMKGFGGDFGLGGLQEIRPAVPLCQTQWVFQCCLVQCTNASSKLKVFIGSNKVFLFKMKKAEMCSVQGLWKPEVGAGLRSLVMRGRREVKSTVRGGCLLLRMRLFLHVDVILTYFG